MFFQEWHPRYLRLHDRRIRDCIYWSWRLYVASIYLRSRNLKQDLSMLEEMEKAEQVQVRIDSNFPANFTNCNQNVRQKTDQIEKSPL